MLGVLNDQQIDALLGTEMVGRIGCHAGGKTYVVPVTYVYDGTFIYSHSKEGLKTEMFKQNPAVCFEVDHIQDMANWQSAVIQGKFQELNGKQRDDALQLLANRLMPFKTGESILPKYGMEKLSTRVEPFIQMVTYRIKVLEKTGRFEKS